MTTNGKNYKNTEDQDINTDENFAGVDECPNCKGEAYANMSDGTDTEADDSGGGGENRACESNDQQDTVNPAYEAALWKEKYMRISAEYENYRKRTLKEKLEIMNAGGEDVVRSMLEVLDDMDRAMAAIAATDDLSAVKQGIILIDNKLRSVLHGKGLAEIEAVGSELDTDLHEAVARIEVEDAAMKGRIIDVVQKGYHLRDKVVRYAKVVVGQ